MARTDQYSGPGNAALAVVVSLKRTSGVSDPIEILSLDEWKNTPANIGLTLVWLTSTHLEISYREPVGIQFQAVKCGGIDISLQSIGNGQ
jgi:hypothetical protein